MAPTTSRPQIHADRMRFTILDGNGVPLPAAGAVYVTDALTKITLKPLYTDGERIREPKAGGGTCLNYAEDPTFDGADLEVELCDPDPYAASLLARGTVLTAQDADVPGYAFPKLGVIGGYRLGLEWWAKRIDDDDLDADWPYAWWLAPKVRAGKHGDRAFARERQANVYTVGTSENANWYDGPLNDWPEASDRVIQWVPTKTVPEPTGVPVAVPAS